MQPLDNIKVLELGQLIAGPYCGQILADFGADVVKVEQPEAGDPMRQWGQTDSEGNTLWWPLIARNKKSITVNLRETEGQARLKQLVAEADILIENFRPGTMERWGLGWEGLSKINPKLIMVRVTGFGQTGPYSSRAGYASVCEAVGGLRYVSGYPDRPPVRVGISLGDTLAGMNAALGALVALHERERSGLGQVVDASIFESVLGVMESIIPDYVKANYIRERAGSILPGIAPSNAYQCKDRRDVIIGANQDSVFSRLCEAIGQKELADDPRFSNHRSRGENQRELDEVINKWTLRHDSSFVIECLVEKGVPVGLTYNAQDMLSDPHFKARESIVEINNEKGSPIPMQNVFPKLSRTPGKIKNVGPGLGEHNDDVLKRWLG